MRGVPPQADSHEPLFSATLNQPVYLRYTPRYKIVLEAAPARPLYNSTNKRLHAPPAAPAAPAPTTAGLRGGRRRRRRRRARPHWRRRVGLGGATLLHPRRLLLHALLHPARDVSLADGAATLTTARRGRGRATRLGGTAAAADRVAARYEAHLTRRVPAHHARTLVRKLRSTRGKGRSSKGHISLRIQRRRRGWRRCRGGQRVA